MYKRHKLWLMSDSDITTAWFCKYMSLSSIHRTRSTWWQKTRLYQIYWQMRLYLLLDVRKWNLDICNAMSDKKSDIDERRSKWSCECETNRFVLKQSKKNSCEIQNLKLPDINHRLNTCGWRTCSESIWNELIQRFLIDRLNVVLFHNICDWFKWQCDWFTFSNNHARFQTKSLNKHCFVSSFELRFHRQKSICKNDCSSMSFNVFCLMNHCTIFLK